MIAFPPAKINIGLNVIRKRADGFHDIESVMMPIPLCDALEVVVDDQLGRGEVVLTRSGLPVPGGPEQDLCSKAVRSLQRDHELPGVRVHLHKMIPMGTGLGGGSSDGANVLLLLDELLQLGLSQRMLLEKAIALGSDCPFFLIPKTQFAEGRGEKLSAVDLDLSGWWLALIHPGVHVPTAEVYGHIHPSGTSFDLASIVAGTSPWEWKDLLSNVMEEYVFDRYPAVAKCKELLYGSGAAYASMSGSGSAVYGLFDHLPVLQVPDGCQVWTFRF